MADQINFSPNRVPWPPLIVLAVILAAFTMNTIIPMTVLPKTLSWFGVLLIAVALIVDGIAMVTMSRARTTIMPHRGSDALVTHGIFRYSRNPIYLANVLIVSGLGFWTGNLWFFVAALATFVLITKLAIEREEAHLSARFGEAFSAYCAKTRRWL